MSQNNKHGRSVIDLPVDGIWKLVKSPGHARFAFDLAVVKGDSHRTLGKSRLQHILGGVAAGDSYSWSRPIHAPISGTVVHAHDGSPDREQLSLLRDIWAMVFSRSTLQPDDISPYAGNHVIIEDADVTVFLAHMQRASLQVAQGDNARLQKGDLIRALRPGRQPRSVDRGGVHN